MYISLDTYSDLKETQPMKKNVTVLISLEAIEALKEHAKKTGRKKSQLVERAIQRCYGKDGQ
jgi:predicted DNA-binding protein